MRLNLGFVYGETYTDSFDGPGGWFRLFGFGLRWKRASARMYFSERNGHTKTYVLFGWRFGVLTPMTAHARKLWIWIGLFSWPIWIVLGVSVLKGCK